MERDAEGSKIKGPLPVRAGGPHYQEVAHTTTNLHHSSTKTWRLETKFSKFKKSLPLTRSLSFPREKTGKNYTTMCPKNQKCHWTQNFRPFLMNLNPMPSPKTYYVWWISHSILSVQPFTRKISWTIWIGFDISFISKRSWTNWIRFDIFWQRFSTACRVYKGGTNVNNFGGV